MAASSEHAAGLGREAVRRLGRGRRRAASSGVRAPGSIRQVQFWGPTVPGVFIRASLPRPRTSCIWIMQVRQREDMVRRTSAHHGSDSSIPTRASSLSNSSREAGSSVSYQPRAVSWSWVPV